MPKPDITVVAVIGAVEVELLDAFVEYYHRLGVDDFAFAFHFPERVVSDQTDALLRRCREIVGQPKMVTTGRWGAGTNETLRDQIRQSTHSDWHVLADIDEFQAFNESLHSTIDDCESTLAHYATGLLVDRLPAETESGSFRSTSELDRAYPIGCFLTAKVLGGDLRKVVLARRDVDVAPGNHYVRAQPNAPAASPVPVHHFKWRPCVRSYLETRAGLFSGSSDLHEQAMRNEATRALAFMSRDTRSQLASLDWFPASIDRWPHDWRELAGAITSRWA